MDDATGQETQTAEQRETLESGLRMLARMIARAHLRRHGSAAAAGASRNLRDGSCTDAPSSRGRESPRRRPDKGR